jgi:hypothetical protein
MLSDLSVAMIYKWKYGPTYLNHILYYVMVSEDLLTNYFLPFSSK